MKAKYVLVNFFKGSQQPKELTAEEYFDLDNSNDYILKNKHELKLSIGDVTVVETRFGLRLGIIKELLEQPKEEHKYIPLKNVVGIIDKKSYITDMANESIKKVKQAVLVKKMKEFKAKQTFEDTVKEMCEKNPDFDRFFKDGGFEDVL